MKGSNVIFSLALVIVILGLVISRIAKEPRAKEPFDRTPEELVYTKHARERMACRDIDEGEVEEIMKKGIINYSKSDRNDRPCPSFALQGTTTSGESLRIVFAQCDKETKVVTAYNLHDNKTCE